MEETAVVQSGVEVASGIEKVFVLIWENGYIKGVKFSLSSKFTQFFILMLCLQGKVKIIKVKTSKAHNLKDSGSN